MKLFKRCCEEFLRKNWRGFETIFKGYLRNLEQEVKSFAKNWEKGGKSKKLIVGNVRKNKELDKKINKLQEKLEIEEIFNIDMKSKLNNLYEISKKQLKFWEKMKILPEM